MVKSKIIELSTFTNNSSLNTFKENQSYYNKRLYILIGIPGSGKSYYAEHSLKNQNTIIVSTDEIRKEIFGSYSFSSNSNNYIINLAKNKIANGLSECYNVVFDATNTNKNYRRKIINIGIQYCATVIGIVFTTSINICIQRNIERPYDRRVPEDKLLLMANFNSKIDEVEEGFDKIIFI